MIILDEFHNGHPIKRVPLLVKNVGAEGSAIIIHKMQLVNENDYLFKLPYDAPAIQPPNSYKHFPIQMVEGFQGTVNYQDYSNVTDTWPRNFLVNYPYSPWWIPTSNTRNYSNTNSYTLYKDTNDQFAFSIIFDPLNTESPQGRYHGHFKIFWGSYQNYLGTRPSDMPFSGISWNVFCLHFTAVLNTSGFVEMDRTDWDDIGEIDRTGIYNIIDIKA